MTNPIQKAIAEVKFRIPLDILTATFRYSDYGRLSIPVNLDAMIRTKVIESRVKVDCDLTGGVELTVPLEGLNPEFLDPTTLIYRVPKRLTQNRSITRVMSIGLGFGPYSSGYAGASLGTTSVGYNGVSPMLDSASGLLSSNAPIPINSSAYVELIGENTVLVTDMVQFPAYAILRCVVENDADFTQLKSTTYHNFCKLVELAVKAYIYNTLIIPIGQGQLSGGQELGKFREIVESYADANELYETYLQETWRAVAIMDNSMSQKRHLRMLTGGLH